MEVILLDPQPQPVVSVKLTSTELRWLRVAVLQALDGHFYSYIEEDVLREFLAKTPKTFDK